MDSLQRPTTPNTPASILANTPDTRGKKRDYLSLHNYGFQGKLDSPSQAQKKTKVIKHSNSQLSSQLASQLEPNAQINESQASTFISSDSDNENTIKKNTKHG
jgi:hypothetical protein